MKNKGLLKLKTHFVIVQIKLYKVTEFCYYQASGSSKLNENSLNARRLVAANLMKIH